NGLASADVGEASFSEAVPVHEERASDPTIAMVRQRSSRLLVLRLGLAYWPGIMLLSLQIRSVVMWNDLVTAFCCCDLVHVIQGSVSGQLSARSLPTMSEIDVNDALIF